MTLLDLSLLASLGFHLSPTLLLALSSLLLSDPGCAGRVVWLLILACISRVIFCLYSFLPCLDGPPPEEYVYLFHVV